MDGTIGAINLQRTEFVGAVPSPHSENVSLITECGTGTIYIVYMTGDDQTTLAGFVGNESLLGESEGRLAA